MPNGLLAAVARRLSIAKGVLWRSGMIFFSKR